MKKILTIAAALLLMQSADALIVSVQGYGEVPAEGMDLMITDGEEDILSGRYTMEFIKLKIFKNYLFENKIFIWRSQ